MIPSFLSIATLFLLLSFSSVASASFRVIFSRVLGRQQAYVWKCEQLNEKTDRVSAVGLIETSIDPAIHTGGRAAATIRCAESYRHHLTRVCEQGEKQFMTRAQHLLQQCLTTPITAAERKLEKTFTFNKDRCAATFRTAFFGGFESVWLCGCQETEGFFVAAGRARLVTTGAPRAVKKELNFLEICTANAKPQLSQVCQNTPEDFELLALQLMQVCCKRARVNFDKKKFECEAAVPSDVSGLKFQSLI